MRETPINGGSEGGLGEESAASETLVQVGKRNILTGQCQGSREDVAKFQCCPPTDTSARILIYK